MPTRLKRYLPVIVYILIALLSKGCTLCPNSMHGESILLAGTKPSMLWFNKIEPGSVYVRSSHESDANNIVYYEEKRDYIIDCERGTIKRSKNSRIPDYTSYILFGKENFDHRGYSDFGNHKYFSWIDYKICRSVEIIEKNTSPCKYLQKSYAKLSHGESFKIVVFGDSISTGAEATTSKLTYFGRFQEYLTKLYPSAEIVVENGSTGGDTTVNGLMKLEEKVLTQNPDLVFIAFGMNDHNLSAFGGIEPDKFLENLKSIITTIKTSTGADVIVLSTFPPNPKWKFGTHRMQQYASATKTAALQTNSAYADVYSIWMHALKRKYPSSLLGNNINHPNNFGHWIYFQALVKIF